MIVMFVCCLFISPLVFFFLYCLIDIKKTADGGLLFFCFFCFFDQTITLSGNTR